MKNIYRHGALLFYFQITRYYVVIYDISGMAFSTLYKKCRDEMLVTSDLLLRTMLNEFLDHEMAKWRRDSEHLYIPVESGVLQQFHKIVQEI